MAEAPPTGVHEVAKPEEATIAALQSASPGWLEPLDVQAAQLLGDLAAESDPRVRLALALTSRQVRRGHVCLDVPSTAATAGPLDEEGLSLGTLQWPTATAWLAALAASPLVDAVPDGAPPNAVAAKPVPLVLEQPSGRLYLRRWWEHEAALAALLAARAGETVDVEADVLASRLARLFPPVAGPADVGRRDQAAAVALAARRRLAVITGGPGTGKTTTVVRLLALLVEEALTAGQAAPRVLLLAPTGKAAARLEESVVGALGSLPVEAAVRAAIPVEAGTIHRALGPRRDGGWRHTAANPLPAEVVVVDEASMIDVALMHALLAAVRPEARLVVLGDRDQLASVEAGAVLADICPQVDEVGSGRVPSAAKSAGPSPDMAQCIARLAYSFRFGPETGIGALARAIQAGDADAALAVLGVSETGAAGEARRDSVGEAGVGTTETGDVWLVSSPPVQRNGRLHPDLEELAADGYGQYLAALGTGTPTTEAIRDALEALGRFRILCAHRRGPTGVGRLGRSVVQALARGGLISPAGESWRGRPVLVTRNDPALRLYNGDVGLVAPDPAMDGRLRAFFPGPDGRPRAVAPPRLPPHETVFSMSIHKSQGSEFDIVAIVLPDVGSPLLTRELLYTAVTRARRRAILFAQPEAVRAAIGRRAERASGLRQRLWGGG